MKRGRDRIVTAISCYKNDDWRVPNSIERLREEYRRLTERSDFDQKMLLSVYERAEKDLQAANLSPAVVASLQEMIDAARRHLDDRIRYEEALMRLQATGKKAEQNILEDTELE